MYYLKKIPPEFRREGCQFLFLKKCLFVEDLLCSGITAISICINHIYKKCCSFADYICLYLSLGLFVLSQNTNIYFFYLTLPLADCANVAWKDGNSVTSSVSNHGSCCDMISLVVCLWLSTLTGKYEFVSLVSALWL